MLFRGDRPAPDLTGLVVLVDDGLATGSTMRAAILAVRSASPASDLVVAVPVGSAGPAPSCAAAPRAADGWSASSLPDPFHAVGQAYRDFRSDSPTPRSAGCSADRCPCRTRFARPAPTEKDAGATEDGGDVGGVLDGFVVVGGIVLVGYLLGRLHILPDTGRDVLARLAFFVASPALLFELLSDAELDEVFSPVLWVTVIATAVSALSFIAVGAIRHWGVAKTTLGSMCASYVNAGNLGLPLAAYVLGDARSDGAGDAVPADGVRAGGDDGHRSRDRAAHVGVADPGSPRCATRSSSAPCSASSRRPRSGSRRSRSRT